MSNLFDSRNSGRPGCGFPSCNTELCRLPPNRSDPHGYYAELGVEPWASPERIKTRVRQLYRRLHPDTGARPDAHRLQRVKLISEVLLNPAERDRYDHTPPGKRMLDKVYRTELSALDFSGFDDADMQKLLRPVPPPPPVTGTGKWYDYLAVDREPRDMLVAQRWYAHLTRTAPLVGHRRQVKVLLHNAAPRFDVESAVMAIPRSWPPSAALAFALWVVVAEGRHPAWRAAPVADMV